MLATSLKVEILLLQGFLFLYLFSNTEENIITAVGLYIHWDTVTLSACFCTKQYVSTQH